MSWLKDHNLRPIEMRSRVEGDHPILFYCWPCLMDLLPPTIHSGDAFALPRSVTYIVRAVNDEGLVWRETGQFGVCDEHA